MLRRLSSPIGVLLARGLAADGAIELHLEPEEAAQGGMVAIARPVTVHCPSCPPGPCERSGGTRRVDELFSAWLTIRPGVVDGARVLLSAQLPGVLRPVAFRMQLAKP